MKKQVKTFYKEGIVMKNSLKTLITALFTVFVGIVLIGCGSGGTAIGGGNGDDVSLEDYINIVCELKVGEANDDSDSDQRVAKSLHFETYNTDPNLLSVWIDPLEVDTEMTLDGIATLQAPDRNVMWKEGTLTMGGVMSVNVKTDVNDPGLKRVKIDKAGDKDGTTLFVSGTGGVNPNLADGGWHEVKIKNMDGVIVTFDDVIVEGFLKKLEVALDREGTTASPIVRDFKLDIKGVASTPDVQEGIVTSVEVYVPETLITALAGVEYEVKIKDNPEVLGGHIEAEFERAAGAVTEGADISSLLDGNNDQLIERKGACMVQY